jgi:2-hydroxychromene-2-carboxylate isomerase
MSEMSAKKEVEFWFEYGSVYSYLSVMRIEFEAQRRDIKIIWKPFLLGAIFQSVGFKTSPFVEQVDKRSYVLQDMPRQCKKYGLKWSEPGTFPRSGLLPLRVALLGIDEPWIGEFSRRVMELNYVFDKDINEPEILAPILSDIGLSASKVLKQANAESTKILLRKQTEQARINRIFGAPTFLIGKEMFWGNDRLDDAFQFAFHS